MHELTTWLKQEICPSLVDADSCVFDNCIEHALSIYLLDFDRDQYFAVAVVILDGILDHIEKDELIEPPIVLN